jgi:hypothetical protein
MIDRAVISLKFFDEVDDMAAVTAVLIRCYLCGLPKRYRNPRPMARPVEAGVFCKHRGSRDNVPQFLQVSRD